ncbi:MAG: hypothetical protein HYR49_04245 [Gammaproteobacteria bacterium]|nr:hypothetical protein [Gammaproteobacteria bacterium]
MLTIDRAGDERAGIEAHHHALAAAEPRRSDPPGNRVLGRAVNLQCDMVKRRGRHLRPEQRLVLGIGEPEERQRPTICQPEERVAMVRNLPNSTSLSDQVAASGSPMTSS